MPAKGSRMIPERNPDAARVGPAPKHRHGHEAEGPPVDEPLAGVIGGETGFPGRIPLNLPALTVC